MIVMCLIIFMPVPKTNTGVVMLQIISAALGDVKLLDLPGGKQKEET